jgi:hypothetical protein
MKPFRRPKPPRKNAARERVLRDWRGGDLPPDLTKNMSATADLMKGVLAKLKLGEGMAEEQLRAAWKDVAGDFISTQTEPVSLENGVLTLRVLQPAMRFHLEQSRGEILARLRKALGGTKLRQVRLTIG